jgi:drug/metabolite transporter, DME family
VDRRLGLLLVALSALVWGSLGVTIKGVFNVAATNAYSVRLLRALVALSASLAICVLVLGKSTFRIALGDLGIMVFAGLLMALNQVAFVFALTLANVTIATLVTLCTVPVCAAILSRALLGEALQSSTLLALVSAIVGVALLVGFDRLTERGASTWIGVSLALLSAASFGLIQVCGRVLANRYHPMQTLSVFFFVAVLALLPITLVNGFVTTYPFVGWLLLAHLGLGISVLGFALLVLGLRTTPVTTAAIVSLLEPLTSTLLAWLLLGERRRLLQAALRGSRTSPRLSRPLHASRGHLQRTPRRPHRGPGPLPPARLRRWRSHEGHGP